MHFFTTKKKGMSVHICLSLPTTKLALFYRQANLHNTAIILSVTHCLIPFLKTKEKHLSVIYTLQHSETFFFAYPLVKESGSERRVKYGMQGTKSVMGLAQGPKSDSLALLGLEPPTFLSFNTEQCPSSGCASSHNTSLWLHKKNNHKTVGVFTHSRCLPYHFILILLLV